jgi:diguanylate cyclase (GGDEF)-like protein
MALVREELQAGSAGGLLLCDVDRFKQVNDTHGHATGDLVLTEIARILERHGNPGRIGGDEFGLWVHDHSEAQTIAEKLIEQVGAAFPESGGLPVSISVGIAPKTDELAAALELADRALYAAKSSGRNCARHALRLAA